MILATGMTLQDTYYIRHEHSLPTYPTHHLSIPCQRSVTHHDPESRSRSLGLEAQFANDDLEIREPQPQPRRICIHLPHLHWASVTSMIVSRPLLRSNSRAWTWMHGIGGSRLQSCTMSMSMSTYTGLYNSGRTKTMIRKRERFPSDDTAEASLIGTRAANTDSNSGDFMKGEVSFHTSQFTALIMYVMGRWYSPNNICSLFRILYERRYWTMPSTLELNLAQARI